MSVIDKLQKYDLYQQIILLLSRTEVDEEAKAYLEEIVKDFRVDWNAFLGYVMMNRVGGVIYRNGLFLKKSVSPYIDRALSLLSDYQKGKNIIHQKAIKEISEALEKENAVYAFLKGSVLNTTLYSVGDRISNDTDIMIRADQIQKVTKVLNGLGYIQGKVVEDKIIPATKKELLFSRLNTYELVPFCREEDPKLLPVHEVDINFRLDNTDINESAEYMLEDTVVLDNGVFPLRTLALEKFFIFLCVHHYREATMVFKIVEGNDLTLYKYMDIHFFLKKYCESVDWNMVKALCDKLGRINDVYATLVYTERLYPETVPENVLKLLEPEDTSFVDSYRGRDNSDEVYKWEMPFEKRFFSYERRLEAMKNIKDETERYKEIMKSLA